MHSPVGRGYARLMHRTPPLRLRIDKYPCSRYTHDVNNYTQQSILQIWHMNLLWVWLQAVSSLGLQFYSCTVTELHTNMRFLSLSDKLVVPAGGYTHWDIKTAMTSNWHWIQDTFKVTILWSITSFMVKTYTKFHILDIINQYPFCCIIYQVTVYPHNIMCQMWPLSTGYIRWHDALQQISISPNNFMHATCKRQQ